MFSDPTLLARWLIIWFGIFFAGGIQNHIYQLLSPLSNTLLNDTSQPYITTYNDARVISSLVSFSPKKNSLRKTFPCLHFCFMLGNVGNNYSWHMWAIRKNIVKKQQGSFAEVCYLLDDLACCPWRLAQHPGGWHKGCYIYLPLGLYSATCCARSISTHCINNRMNRACIWGIANSIWIILHKSENVIVADIPISIISERDDHNWVTLNVVYWTAVHCPICCDCDLCNETSSTKNPLSCTLPGQRPKYLLLFVQLMAILIFFPPSK